MKNRAEEKEKVLKKVQELLKDFKSEKNYLNDKEANQFLEVKTTWTALIKNLKYLIKPSKLLNLKWN